MKVLNGSMRMRALQRGPLECDNVYTFTEMPGTHTTLSGVVLDIVGVRV